MENKTEEWKDKQRSEWKGMTNRRQGEERKQGREENRENKEEN